MDELPYATLPRPPSVVSPSSVMARLLDGLGFRFRWATEGLREEDYEFRGCEGSLSVSELVGHVWGLVNWVHLSLTGSGIERPERPEEVRRSVLETVFALRAEVLSLDPEALARVTIHDHPFWNIINGPLSDALTHVGQINLLRRQTGNPTPRANVFLGRPPSQG